MLINALLIIGIFLIVVYIAYYYYKVLKEEEKFEIPENTYTIEYLVQTTAQIFADRQAQNVKDMNLSKEELLNKEKQRNELRDALRRAAYGDREAKEYIILSIRDLMRKEANRATLLDIDEVTINKVIHFDDRSLLKPRDKFEIIMHLYKKKHDDKALNVFVNDFDLKTPVITEEGEIYYDITAEMIDEAYDEIMSQYDITYSDKLDILARRIFASYKGFGAADILFDFSIDEIDCGVSGIPKDSYEIKQLEDLLNDKNRSKGIEYSYKSIWIMLSALKIHLSFLEFESQKELVRVCQNIYKYDASEMLSRKKGYVISTMINGSRIVVVRPPMASSWAFFARKFDSVASVAPQKLLIDDNAVIPITIMKWLIRGYQSMVISGAMGTGKTTFLKSMFRFLPADLAIRVFEASGELNAQYTYPSRNILALQETESIKMQEELDLGMKLNSDVTVIGEMASQESVSWYVQSARKGSKIAIGTIHTKTARALIDYVRDSLPGYTDKKAAEEAAIAAIRFDVHLEKEKDHRYLERITQIVPVIDRRYPSQKEENKDLSIEEKHMLDAMEYQHRQTDRQLFVDRNIVEYRNGCYYLVNMPTEDVILSIKNYLSVEEEKEFLKDMDTIKKINDQRLLQDKQNVK